MSKKDEINIGDMLKPSLLASRKTKKPQRRTPPRKSAANRPQRAAIASPNTPPMWLGAIYSVVHAELPNVTYGHVLLTTAGKGVVKQGGEQSMYQLIWLEKAEYVTRFFPQEWPQLPRLFRSQGRFAQSTELLRLEVFSKPREAVVCLYEFLGKP